VSNSEHLGAVRATRRATWESQGGSELTLESKSGRYAQRN
jgi:hypothetical protein